MLLKLRTTDGSSLVHLKFTTEDIRGVRVDKDLELKTQYVVSCDIIFNLVI